MRVLLLALAALFLAAPAVAQDGPDEDGVYNSSLERDPVLIGGLEGLMSRVRYPETSRRLGSEGTVYVQFVVDTDGSVFEVHPVRGPFTGVERGPEPRDSDERATWQLEREAAILLEHAAVEAVEASRFEPGMQKGRPVKVRYTLPVRFVLR